MSSGYSSYVSLYFVFGRNSVILFADSSLLNNGKPHFRTLLGNNLKKLYITENKKF